MVSIGAVIHALLTAKATLRRMASRGSKTKSQRPPLLNPTPAPAPFAPWSAVRDADDVSTIAASRTPKSLGSRLPSAKDNRSNGKLRTYTNETT